MTSLLGEILEACGGLERWQSVTALTARGRFGGLLRWRLPGNRLADVVVRIEMSAQQAVLVDFPSHRQRTVFDRGDVRIESEDGEVLQVRRSARSAFTGIGGLRRNFRWDALDAGYFAGYALWNYLSAPLLLTLEGIEVREGRRWREDHESWRRLEVTFPPGIHTHSPRQTFYVDPAGLIRRHDYVAEPVGGWARAAHYSSDHREFDGLVFPTRRRVHPIGLRGRSLPGPTLVALDIDHIEVEKQSGSTASSSR